MTNICVNIVLASTPETPFVLPPSHYSLPSPQKDRSRMLHDAPTRCHQKPKPVTKERMNMLKKKNVMNAHSGIVWSI